MRTSLRTVLLVLDLPMTHSLQYIFIRFEPIKWFRFTEHWHWWEGAKTVWRVLQRFNRRMKLNLNQVGRRRKTKNSSIDLSSANHNISFISRSLCSNDVVVACRSRSLSTDRALKRLFLNRFFCFFVESTVCSNVSFDSNHLLRRRFGYRFASNSRRRTLVISIIFLNKLFRIHLNQCRFRTFHHSFAPFQRVRRSRVRSLWASPSTSGPALNLILFVNLSSCFRLALFAKDSGICVILFVTYLSPNSSNALFPLHHSRSRLSSFSFLSFPFFLFFSFFAFLLALHSLPVLSLKANHTRFSIRFTGRSTCKNPQNRAEAETSGLMDAKYKSRYISFWLFAFQTPEVAIKASFVSLPASNQKVLRPLGRLRSFAS